MYPFDQSQQHVYEDYAYAYDTGDYRRVDLNRAMDIVQRFMQSAPPDMVQGLLEQYFEQMPPEFRMQFVQCMPSQYDTNPNNPRQMAQSFHYQNQQQPGWRDQLSSQGGPSGNPLFKGVIMGMAALIAKHVLDSQLGDGFRGRSGGYQHAGYGERGRNHPQRRGGGLGNIIGGLGELFGGEGLGEYSREDDERGTRRYRYDESRGYRRYRHHDDDDDDDD